MDYTGQTIDKKYRIVRLLGEGGMGSVYLAEHVLIGRRVAVKFLIAEFASEPDLVKRFFREARAAAAIDHQNIIDVLDVGISPQGEPYIVMEYLQGESLADLMERCGPLDLSAALGIIEPVLRALDAVHKKGIVHRDLKPENVFIVKRTGDPPLVKLIDFGISKYTGGPQPNTKLTQTGTLLGTPEYMSPEQARGKGDVDHRADIYAVGLMLYEMLARELPFTGENYNTLLINILTKKPKSILEVCPTLAPAVEGPLMRAIAKRPDQRFQSTKEMLDALQGLELFDDRAAALRTLVETNPNKGVAAGYLGSEIRTDQSGIAESVFAEMTETLTSTDWSKSVATRPKKPVHLPGVIGFLAIVIVLAVGAFFSFSERTQPVKPEVTVSNLDVGTETAEPQEDSIKIDVQGVIPDSKIYYNGSLVTANPFWVKSGKTMVDLRVEKDGFKPFKLMLEPSGNRVVEVVMTPLAAKNNDDRGSVKRTPKSEPSRAASKKTNGKRARKIKRPHKPRKKKVLKRSGNRSKYTERFE